MSHDDWQEIQNGLSLLLGNEALATFHPLLETLQRYSSARQYAPEIYRAFMELIQHMKTDVQQGRSISDLLEHAISGIYVQPDWDVHSVFQANGHVFQFILGNFRDQIEPQEPDPRIPVPIVLVVMTATEAEELVSGEAFQGYPPELRHSFEQLRTLLAVSEEAADWTQRYRSTPEAWQPFSTVDGAETIEGLVRRALAMVEGCGELLVPHFIHISAINKDDPQSRRELRCLRDEGCVVIVDVISMRHPAVQREFRRSLLDAFPRTLVTKVAPINDALRIVRQMVIVIEQHIDLEFYKRLNIDWDDRCQEISEPDQFGRWLKSQVPKLLPDELKSKTGTRKYWYQSSGVE